MNATPRAVAILLGILTTIMVGWVLHIGAGIIQPLVIALLLASMLQPVVRWVARFHVPPAITVILIVSLFFTGATALGFTLQERALRFFGKYEELGRTAQTAITAPTEEGDPAAEDQVFGWESFVKGIEKELVDRETPEWVSEIVSSNLEQVDTDAFASVLVGGGFSFLKGLLLVVIYMLFIFAEQTVFRRKILSIFDDRREEARKVLDTIGRGIQRYLGVKTVVSLATGSLCYAALVALDVPQPLLLGALTFAMNYIPTFGSFIAGLVATVVALIANDVTSALIVLTTFVTVNTLLGSYIEPKILGRELNLSPLVVIISVVVWAGVWGAVGTFLAVPLTATIQIILASNESTRPIAIMLSSGPPRDRSKARKTRQAA